MRAWWHPPSYVAPSQASTMSLAISMPFARAEGYDVSVAVLAAEAGGVGPRAHHGTDALTLLAARLIPTSVPQMSAPPSAPPGATIRATL